MSFEIELLSMSSRSVLRKAIFFFLCETNRSTISAVEDTGQFRRATFRGMFTIASYRAHQFQFNNISDVYTNPDGLYPNVSISLPGMGSRKGGLLLSYLLPYRILARLEKFTIY